MNRNRQTGRTNFLFIHVNEWATIDSPDTIPISQAYALATLRKYGYNGTILGDYKGTPLPPKLFRHTLASEKPDVLGFSVYDENINRVLVWARHAKQLRPEILIILGGPQITFMPGEALVQMKDVDILCRGEGESVLPALGRVLDTGRSLAEVPGICYLEQGKAVDTPRADVTEDLDLLPSPYLEGIIDTAAKSRVTLFTSRGCTSPCTFCYTTRASNKKVRFHSIDRVIAEIKHLQARGISDFWFADPNFAFSRTRLVELLQRIIAECPHITFWCQTRYNLIDDELLDLLKKAGAHTVAFGLESADHEVLGKINKGLNPAKLAKVIGEVQQAGINVELFTLFGLPGESFSHAQKTLDFVKANKVSVSGNSISQQLHLFFGIPILDDPEAHGIKPLAVTKPAYQSICRDFATDAMSEDEIRWMSMLWRLNRQDFQENIATGTNLFEVAGFITANFEALSCRSEALLMLARIYLYLEEFQAARQCMVRLKEKFPHDPHVNHFLAGPFTGFRFKRRGIAAPGCRVIYDCKGILNGQVVPVTEAYYQDAKLGSGRLLPDFEAGLLGMKAGRVSQYPVRFPADYGHRELAGRTVMFQVFLHQVMEPVIIENMAGFLDNPPKNIYRFNDLEGLRKQNETLYYMVLKDSLPQKLMQEMTDYLSLINFYLRLGFRQQAEPLLDLLPRNGSTLEHAGRILLADSWPEKAYEILSTIADSSTEAATNCAKALIKMKRYDEAEKIVGSPSLSHDIQALDLRVGLASLRQQPLEIYLARMDDLLDRQISYM
ncbi:MAG: radical SAM protein [Proteobacteria bacterium]|nr:radical SAM protein [Pseudomonadota bacterium]MBU4297041.1 radical SAM protein [Pseudomonadota bacterium]MCG2749922.1 radical SAM protein [Desulfobulbaceae bacterium]